MGLIVSLAYGVHERAVDLELTFTAMGCPAMDFIQDDIRERLLAEPDVDDVRIEVVWDPVWTRAASARTRARRCASWGSWREPRDVWEVFARAAYEEPLHHVGTVTEEDEDLALVSRARDLRRAAVDRDDHRAAHRDPGGDPLVSTAMASLSPRSPTTRPRSAAATPSGPSALRRSSRPSPRRRWPRTSSATRARPTPCSSRSAPSRGTRVEGGPHRLALLDDELPDWTAFVAANLLVDGVLTTFVAACVDSSRDRRWPSARARSSRRRARTACTARRGHAACAGRARATRSSSACARRGSRPGAGRGRTTTPSHRAPLEQGALRHDAVQQREQVRVWLVDLLGDEGVEITLDEPSDWSRWDPEWRRYEP